MLQTIDKALVARRFGRCAESYEAATPVQAGMAEDLHAYVLSALAGRVPARILELGCGSGRLTRLLRASFPGAALTSLDIAPDMVALARRGCPGADFLVADAEAYLEDCQERFDLVVSNATMQWFQSPEASLGRCRALLTPGGLMALTTFGSDTFRELRAALAQAYARCGRPPRRHVGEFPEAAHWRALLPGADVAEWRVQPEFPDVRGFLRSVQAAGATNAFAAVAPLQRDILRHMLADYDQRFRSRDGRGVTGTYHVVRIAIPAEERGQDG